MSHRLASSEIFKLSELLSVFDQNSDGVLEVHELEQGLTRLGLQMSRLQIRELLAPLAKHGAVTVEDFINSLRLEHRSMLCGGLQLPI